MPFMAVLLASLAPEVKITSDGCAPSAAAIRFRLSVKTSLDSRPALCLALALPMQRRSVSQKHASTSASTGVLAL